MSYDLFDMSKIMTIGGNRYCSVFVDNGRYATAIVHAPNDEIPAIVDRVLSQTPERFRTTKLNLTVRPNITHSAYVMCSQNTR